MRAGNGLIPKQYLRYDFFDSPKRVVRGMNVRYMCDLVLMANVLYTADSADNECLCARFCKIHLSCGCFGGFS
jgi:hypothetical protein